MYANCQGLGAQQSLYTERDTTLGKKNVHTILEASLQKAQS